MKLQTGATLQNGKYLLSQALGSEGVGATYLATQTLLNQGVVIKTLDPSLQVTRSFPQLRAKFIEEVRLLARTQHPSIVRVLDFFEEDQLPCLVMEFVSGQALATLVSIDGALAEAEAIHYIRQVGAAVSVAHGNGLIHRNIQPRSLIRRQGTNLAILVGFGFAHDLASPSLPPTQINPFTPTWEIESETAIDRYGLAATLYYLLSGHAPTAPISLDQYSWNDTTKEAILQGMNPALRSQSVEEWLRLLPNTTLPLIGAPAAASEFTPPPRPVSLPTTVPQVTPPHISAPQAASPKVIEPDVAKRNAPSVVKAPQTPPPPPPLKITQPAATLNASPKPTLQPAAKPLTQQPIAAYSGMRRHFPKFLVITGAAATALGLGFGLALRISAAKAPGASIFHPAQTFSDRTWKGTLSPSGDPDIPVEKAAGSYDSKPPTTTDWTMPKNLTEQGSVDVPPARLTPPIQPTPELERSLPQSKVPQTEPDPIDIAPVPAEAPLYSPVEPAPIKPPKVVSPVEPAPALPTAPEPPVRSSSPSGVIAPVPPASSPFTSEQREIAPEPPARNVTGN